MIWFLQTDEFCTCQKLTLLQAPWTTSIWHIRIRRLPTLMPRTSKRSARNVKHMVVTVVWVPFFRRRGNMTSNNDEVWQKIESSWHCWQVCGVLLSAKNWLNWISDDVKMGRSCATHMSNCIYLLWWKEDVASSRVWGIIGFTCKTRLKRDGETPKRDRFWCLWTCCCSLSRFDIWQLS